MDKKRNVIAIIQARMRSSRLPGKILMDISGRPMLWHLQNRLRKSTLINKIIIATSLSIKDNAVEDFCAKYTIDIYRGSENDVLDRYYNAAKIYKADIVVRVTGDCPLMDVEIADKVISASFADSKIDMASNVIKRTYPRGLDAEVISFRTLEKVWNEARKGHYREHVTAYIYDNISSFNVRSVENETDLSYLRWTVDEEKDLELVRELYKRLYRDNNIFSMQDVLKILEKEPWLKEINKNVKQKVITG